MMLSGYLNNPMAAGRIYVINNYVFRLLFKIEAIPL